MLKVLNDPYADLYSAKQMANVLSQLSGSMTGIGVVLVKEKGRIVVRDVIADSPAESAGLQVEDELQQINGQAVKGALDDVTKRIHGAAGTVVKLKVRKRDGKMVDLAIRRQPIHFSSVGGLWRDGQGQSRYWLDAERGLAYVQIVAVDQKVAGKTQKLIEQLKGQGLKGLVLDLRNCPGGTLQAIPKIVGLFQKEGRLLTINSTNGGRDFVYDSDGNCWMGDFPVVVLINGGTTSAAEVIAGALQELGRAVLVGDRTCGKGSIQALVPVEGGEGLKVTVGEMLLPSGRRLQRVAGDPTWGVDPNDGFYVPLTAAGQQAAKAARQEFSRGQTTSPAKLTPELIQQKLADPQLAAAVRTLSAKVYGGQFAKVGQPLAALVAHYEQIRQRREHLLSQLKQLEGELGGSAE